MPNSKYIAVRLNPQSRIEFATKEGENGLDAFLEKNHDYSDGGIQDEVILETAIPYMEVGIWQLEIVLNRLNLLSLVNAEIDSLPEPTRTDVMIAWAKGTKVETTSASVQLIKEALKMSNQQVYDLFIAAEKVSL